MDRQRTLRPKTRRRPSHPRRLPIRPRLRIQKRPAGTRPGQRRHRNNNGTIDTGRELFGDNTLKSDGKLAINGFDALADLDSNQDGKVDANDTDFSKLRVWQDLNQDGESQTDELKTLDQLNIQSINAAGENVLQNLGNNNQAIARGSFTFKDGHTSTAGAAASLNLAVNNFHREFTDTIEIPQTLQTLPDMTGSGDVRDLKEENDNDFSYRQAA
jgi:hypothetical protein